MEVATGISFLGLSLLDWTAIAAVATVVLAAGAIITSIFAIRAFGKQSAELGILQQQAGEQRKVNEKQVTVLELQATELQGSLAERKRLAEEQRRAQANQVAAWFGRGEVPGTVPRINGPEPVAAWGAFIRNESALPILSVRVFFNYISAESTTAEAWQPVLRGGPPDRIRVIPPRSERFIEIPAEIKNMIEQCDENIYAVSLEFTDAAGIRWQRDARGGLKDL